MFGDKIVKAASKYFEASSLEKKQLRIILEKEPAKASALILVFGGIVLRNFCKAKLRTPYREASPYLYQEAMTLCKKVTDEITDFVLSAGDAAVMEICKYLKTNEVPTAIQACFVLLNINNLSYEALQEIDYSLHHLGSKLPYDARMHVSMLIVIIQAQNNYGDALRVIQREAQSKGMNWREAAHVFIASAYDFILVPSYTMPKQEARSVDVESNNGPDLAAMYYTYYTFWDPDNAPWNYD